LTLPFRDNVGDVPLKPGFCMPRPPPVPFPLPAGRGFFRLDRNGLRITGVTDEPLELNVVVIDIVLPFVWLLPATVAKYGFPLASVTDMVPPPPPPAHHRIVCVEYKIGPSY